MQIFIDTVTQEMHAFEHDVQVIPAIGRYIFKTATGVQLDVPTTLQPYTATVQAPD